MDRRTMGSLVFVLHMAACLACGGDTDTVKVWEEPLVLPTYQVHPPDVNPMFRRPLSYQGASRVIYPYPLQDNLSNVREDQTYTAVYLENQYIKLCVLPEFGGRLFYATDKTDGYEMFYRQHVIKPSNIGMLGAWISGGIEWCVLHHHRASTFMPVDYCTRENPDGSKTIWVGEIEPRHRMHWTIGITLCPGKSTIRADVKIVNRTANTHSFLYWANVAAHVNDQYQVFFPPSTEYGVYHAKSDFLHWPIAQERYRGIDYSGVDVSWWKNHPRPISIFAYDLKEGFLAGYDHGQRAGTIHVGNHHIVAGAKLWEWGPGEEGSMWDTKVLTDSDGPYAELMVGAYSDNQPDYSWIGPYEVKEATQCWYPLRELGGVTSANLQAAINLHVTPDGQARLGLNVTEKHDQARIELKANGKTVLQRIVDISPAAPFDCRIPLPPDTKEGDLEASLSDAEGKRLITYRPLKRATNPQLPPTVEPPPAPKEIKTVEELYLAGLRIKQFHNARLDPNDYFREALSRDPGDSRCNIQLGLDAARRAQFEEAADRFETAIRRISRDYTRPRDCEAYYQLGLVLRRLGRDDEAYDHLYRAVWDHAFFSAGHYQMAEISCAQGRPVQALGHIDHCLATSATNTKAWGLKSAILRQLGRLDESLAAATKALAMDPLDYLAGNERVVTLAAAGRQEESTKQWQALRRIMRDHAEAYLELAVDYINAGLAKEALDVLARAIESDEPAVCQYPTVHYYLAYLHEMRGDEGNAKRFRETARRCPTDYCFPFRLETIDVLRRATQADPDDARAHYFLGNLLFDRQPEAAMDAWRRAVEIEPTLAIAHRNLGWGYYYACDDMANAIASYQRAIEHNPKDARYYYELDVLHERAGTPVDRRLALLESHHEYVVGREDALIREIIVLVQAGKYDQAIRYLDEHYFHIQEGNRRLHDTYVDAHLLRGLMRYHQQDFEGALEDFQRADAYPENHQIGRDRRYERNAQIWFLTAQCLEALARGDEAQNFLHRAAQESRRGPDSLYYQGLAHRELGQEEEASKAFARLVELGRQRLRGSEGVEFFAKFGEGTMPHQRKAAAHYAIGLGLLGQGDRTKAKENLKTAVTLDGNQPWARYHLEHLD